VRLACELEDSRQYLLRNLYEVIVVNDEQPRGLEPLNDLQDLCRLANIGHDRLLRRRWRQQSPVARRIDSRLTRSRDTSDRLIQLVEGEPAPVINHRVYDRGGIAQHPDQPLIRPQPAVFAVALIQIHRLKAVAGVTWQFNQSAKRERRIELVIVR